MRALIWRANPIATFQDIRGKEFFRDTLNGYSKQRSKSVDYGVTPAGTGYKARHLAGVWATAPFLHNGSVPSLRAEGKFNKVIIS